MGTAIHAKKIEKNTSNGKIETLEDAKDFLARNRDQWKSILTTIDNAFMVGRDSHKVPIYLTKARIKSADSSFLKFKRKQRDDPQTITDWIGFRVLCLFHQDIKPTYEFILDLLLNGRQDELDTKLLFEINEIILFNMGEKDHTELNNSLHTSFSNRNIHITEKKTEKTEIAYSSHKESTKPTSLSFKTEDRDNGYQSIHLVFTVHGDDIQPLKCEIQLRTLLQDVWGELEHTLSYKKGKIHPHISKSFELLSKELKAKDELISQLRNIRDEQAALLSYQYTNSGPSKWLGYPTSFLTAAFPTDDLQNLYKAYQEICRKHAGSTQMREWVSQAESALKDIIDATNEHAQKNINDGNILTTSTSPLNYFIAMETAFIDFSMGDLIECEKKYRKILETDFGKEHWPPYFRIGEVSLALERVEDALVAFDQCERKQSETTGTDLEVIDHYYSKIGLAYSYWSLGKDFLPIVIKIIKSAKETISTSTIDTNTSLGLSNSLCYYHLEFWLNTPSDSSVVEIHQREQAAFDAYKELKESVDKNKEIATSNALDTLAWFRYNQCIREKTAEKRIELISEAAQYIVQADKLSNRSPSRMTSIALHREHLQIILKAKNDLLKAR